MKIALLAHAGVIHTRRWAEGLAGRGHRVALISIEAAEGPLPAGVALHRLPWPTPVGYVLNARRLRNLLAEIQPDVLHAHYASGYGLLGRLAKFHPWVLSVWGSDVFHFPDQAKWKHRLVAANLCDADWVCSTSETMAERTREVAPEIKQLSVIAFGVDTSLFCPAAAVERKEIIVGTVKTLRPVYGIDLLIRGFAACREKLRGRRPETAARMRLRIVGGGWQRRALEKLADGLGIRGVTTFTGPVKHSEVASELAGFDIYVAPSRAESFGVAVVEASSCGLPVVVTRVGGLPEVVADGETGLIVPPESPEAIADALARLIAEPTQRHEFGAAGRRRVVKRYQFADNVDQMIGVYDQLLSHSQTFRRAA